MILKLGMKHQAIYMYITILVKQVYWYISQVSGERLQDHWSSGFHMASYDIGEIYMTQIMMFQVSKWPVFCLK